MQAILLAIPALLSTVGSAAAGIGTAVAGAAGAAAGAVGLGGSAAAGSGVLSALRVGTSAVSALSTFAAGHAEANALRDEASNEQLNARAEFINAQEKANAITDEFNQTVAEQLAVTSASGIDVGSGSVREARRFAQSQADRQIGIARRGADLNAALRRARAASLRSQAGLTDFAALLGGASKVGDALFDTARLGGKAA